MVILDKIYEALNTKYPDHTFDIVEGEKYKDGGVIYTVTVDDECSFQMLDGYINFTEEQTIDNFVEVARLTMERHRKEQAGEVDKINGRTGKKVK